MKPYEYIGEHNYPTIILDKDKGVFLIRGRSFPDDAYAVFHPAIEWMEEYAKNPNQETVFVFRLYYYNSSTAKALLEILNILQQLHDDGYKVKVQWVYHEDDEVILEQGEDYASIFDLEFEFIPYSDKPTEN